MLEINRMDEMKIALENELAHFDGLLGFVFSSLGTLAATNCRRLFNSNNSHEMVCSILVKKRLKKKM